MRRLLLLLITSVLVLAVAGPAGAGKYGKVLDKDSASGDWYDQPAASARGTVAHPRSFTVVVKGDPVMLPKNMSTRFSHDPEVA